MRLLQVHVTSGLGQCEEDSSSTSTDNENKILAKNPRLFGFVAAGSKKKKKPSNSVRKMERYFEEEIIHFDHDPLMYWKKKSELSTLSASAKKEYLGLTATSAPSNTFRNLMFIKCNSNMYDKVKL